MKTMLYKFVLIFGIVLLCAFAASGQTVVNLTVTDTPDNQTWNNGTWSVKLQPAAGNLSQTNSFTLLSGGGSLAAQSGSLSGTATAAISLPANANIAPTSNWQFTVCPQPSNNAACFQQSVTVSTSSPQTLNITPPSIRINLATATPPVSAYATGEISAAVGGSQFYLIGTGIQVCSVVSGSTCTTWAGTGGGGGITQGATLPATCTPSSTGPFQVTAATTYGSVAIGPGTVFYCDSTNHWTPVALGSGAGPVVGWYLGPQCPTSNTGQCFFTLANTQVDNTCSWASTGPTITCSDGPFVAGD